MQVMSEHSLLLSWLRTQTLRDFLVVQWLGLCLPMGGCGFDPWLGNWDPTCLGAKKSQGMEQRQCCSKFSEDFENGPHQKIFKKKKRTQTLELDY